MATALYEKWEEVPDTLKTKTSLGREGLRLTKDQQPAARIRRWRKTRRGWDEIFYDLYSVEEAIPKREATAAQLAALSSGREKAMRARTCQGCGQVMKNANWLHGGLCRHCRKEADTLEYIADVHDEAVAWARQLLAAGNFVVLDAETTGLPGEVIELAVVSSSGEILINTRLNPIGEIDPGATAVHGITKEMLVNEPTFPNIYKRLKRILKAATAVVIYNEAFDTTCLQITAYRHGVEVLSFDSECAMIQYAKWCGQYSEYWGDFRYQPLPGGDHTAVGDALATLRLIKGMADG